MPSRSEISINSGRCQIILKGPDAIREAGWSLRFLLFAQGAYRFLFGGILAICALLNWWLSLGL
jgi:hypothetical protein